MTNTTRRMISKRGKREIVNSELAIIHATSPHGRVDTCALYNPHFGSIPQKLEYTPPYHAYMPLNKDGCTDYHDLTKFLNATSFVYAGNCTVYQKLTKAQQAGAKQVIIVSKSGTDFPHGTKDQFNYIHIPVGMILDSSWQVVQAIGEPLVVQFWHPHDPLFDPNLLIIWLLAVFSILVGAYWSGVTTQEREQNLADNLIDVQNWGLIKAFDRQISYRLAKEGDNLASGNVEDNDDDSMRITPVTIVVFIGMICSVLLLLYFFYKYLIYAVIGLFAIAACNGVFDCLKAIVNQVNICTCKTPLLPYIKRRIEYRMIVLFLICLGFVIWWIIVRHAPYAWILQDFLGVCFCISLVKLIKLPNFKISMFLLVALLVYDIFFVFITPLFSARGKSVMVEVATGKGSTEQLPMVIRVPKLIKSALSLCERPYSLLGFGDILLPGLFVGFCRNFDIIAVVPRSLYFVASMIGYGCGLLITFVALVYMKSGQPALLYLVPAVLLPVLFLSLARKEFKSIWHGKVRLEPKDADADSLPGQNESDIELKVSDNPKSSERRPLLPLEGNDS
eukprot:gene19498-21424_t